MLLTGTAGDIRNHNAPVTDVRSRAPTYHGRSARAARCEGLAWEDGFAHSLGPRRSFFSDFAAVGGGGDAAAADRCAQPVARVAALIGTVEYRTAGSAAWQPAALDLAICADDRLRTGADSRAAIAFLGTDTIVRMDQNTVLRLRAPPSETRSLFQLLDGTIESFSRTPRALEVDTPFVNAAVEGTEFLIAIAPGRARITVFEGRILARNARGSLSLTDGQSSVIVAGAAPQPEILVHPRDAVRWALYYPPVLTTGAGATPEVREAARLLAAGQADAALARLARAPETAPALALRAVIAVAQNDTAEAERLAAQAVARDPGSAAARIALSYALQADRRIEAARDQLREAVKRAPDSALAWARLAELDLMLGRRDDASEAAATAARLAPDDARMNTVLGFAALSAFSIEEAEAAFHRAIAKDTEDPLPHLGLGLARIRSGDLAAGRREIEIATALDVGSSLLRSYLGKAYFEEDRSRLAGTELRIAKELDPRDPTPYLYDAVRKEAENRPVEAMHDLQRSVELNDSRAVYRSRQLLDADAATRGANLARIYTDLGFDQLAVLQSGQSLAVDPANFSAHRFLSDSYATLPRHEIARASELFQSQMLQPVGLTPVQPSSKETDLRILSDVGPAEPAFNEFTPLFTRDGVQLQGTGLVGNERTFSDETVLSALSGPAAFSLGQYHYQTQGFRENDDLLHNIYDAFGQLAVGDKLSVQAELRRRRSGEGDVRLNFDPSDFSTIGRQDTDDDTQRIAAHFTPAPGQDVLLSATHTHRDQDVLQTPMGTLLSTGKSTGGFDLQGEYLLNAGLVQLTAGMGYANLGDTLSGTLDITNTFPGGICLLLSCLLPVESRAPIIQRNAYLYGTLRWPDTVTWTAALSYDEFRQQPVERKRLDPKFGVRWDIADRLRLRLAYIETVRRALVASETLEPTQIAGFNQFYDDFTGTRVRLLGLGVDGRVSDDLFVGAEARYRRLSIPVTANFATAVTEKQNEDLYRAYLYWAPQPRWAFSAEGRYETFKNRDQNGATLPTLVETASVPVAAHFFDPSGLFAVAGPTFVHQHVALGVASAFPKTSEFVRCAGCGRRFPAARPTGAIEPRGAQPARRALPVPGPKHPDLGAQQPAIHSGSHNPRTVHVASLKTSTLEKPHAQDLLAPRPLRSRRLRRRLHRTGRTASDGHAARACAGCPDRADHRYVRQPRRRGEQRHALRLHVGLHYERDTRAAALYAGV